jgi:hypothetical protein
MYKKVDKKKKNATLRMQMKLTVARNEKKILSMKLLEANGIPIQRNINKCAQACI